MSMSPAHPSPAPALREKLIVSSGLLFLEIILVYFQPRFVVAHLVLLRLLYRGPIVPVTVLVVMPRHAARTAAAYECRYGYPNSLHDFVMIRKKFIHSAKVLSRSFSENTIPMYPSRFSFTVRGFSLPVKLKKLSCAR